MDAPGQGRVIDRLAGLEAEEPASLVGRPEAVVRHVPIPKRELRALRGEAHARLARPQRLLRAPLVLDGDSEQHERRGRHQQEELERERVLHRHLLQEGPVSFHRPQYRLDRDDHQGGGDPAQAEAERGPDQQGNGGIEQRRRRVRPGGQAIERQVPDRHEQHGQRAGLHDAARRELDRLHAEEVDAEEDCRHEHDRGHAVRDAEVPPLEPVAGSEAVGDGERGAPERRPERNRDDRDQDEDHGLSQRDAMGGRGDEEADAGRGREVLQRVERLALQGVPRRPPRLLRRNEMHARGGQQVGPPLPRRDQQQDGNEDRVRREEQRDLAVGEAHGPGETGRQVVERRGGQHRGHRVRREHRMLAAAGAIVEGGFDGARRTLQGVSHIHGWLLAGFGTDDPSCPALDRTHRVPSEV